MSISAILSANQVTLDSEHYEWLAIYICSEYIHYHLGR